MEYIPESELNIVQGENEMNNEIEWNDNRITITGNRQLLTSINKS